MSCALVKLQDIGSPATLSLTLVNIALVFQSSGGGSHCVLLTPRLKLSEEICPLKGLLERSQIFQWLCCQKLQMF